MNHHVIAIANQKGGVGKTTTTVNLAQALTHLLPDSSRILIVDFDPQGNATQASGIKAETIQTSISELIRDRLVPEQSAIYQGARVDIIPATSLLAQVELEMAGITNSELRLAYRLRKLKPLYSVILIDCPPSFGKLMNSALNAADSVIVPVDSNVFALNGIKTLLGKIEDIREGTNPEVQVLGYLLTNFDTTVITKVVRESLVEGFGDLVFHTKIRRSVKLREAQAHSRTIFHHAPDSTGAEDYTSLATEVIDRINIRSASALVEVTHV